MRKIMQLETNTLFVVCEKLINKFETKNYMISLIFAKIMFITFINVQF